MKILKFSTPTCGQCRLVEQQLKKQGIRFEEVDCSSDEGTLRAGYYNIAHVPTVLIINDDESVHERYGNLPTILDALKAGKFNIEHNNSGLIDFV